ncbi:MAG: GldG family protein [Chloroflexota bacterium]|nr:GldG family protein [Chloroflexota bacterium]
MAEQTPNLNPIEESVDQEPFIPPGLLLLLAFGGVLVALFVLFTQPTFGVVGIGAAFVGVVCLVLWVVTAPDQARGVLSGRTLRYGGTSLIVTLVVLAAMIAIYTVVRGQGLRFDLTQSNNFSLTDESRAAITGIGVDPGILPIQILAFYGVNQAGARDQDSVLFDSYIEASGGKLSYRFIDPDQDPLIAEQFTINRGGQIVITQQTTNDAGQTVFDVENSETISAADQGLLTNAILKVAASGTFNAFFLTGDDTASDQMTTLKRSLTEQFDWNVRDTALIGLTSPEGEFRLNDPNVDGEVVISPGGSQSLSDQELLILTDYLDAGGSVIIFAGDTLNPDGESLATAANLNEYLFANFGLRINNDLVIDPSQSFLSPASPYATALDSTSFITSNGINRAQAAVVFEVPHSITVTDAPPANVTVTSLIRSSGEAYGKTNIAALLAATTDEEAQSALARGESDPTGPFTLAASAENTVTGAKVVIFGSTSPALDTFTQFQTSNLDVAFNSLIWTTDFNNFFSQIVVQQQQRPQDAPLSVTEQGIRDINLIALIALPFGVLALGILVWWNGRERARG